MTFAKSCEVLGQVVLGRFHIYEYAVSQELAYIRFIETETSELNADVTGNLSNRLRGYLRDIVQTFDCTSNRGVLRRTSSMA